MIYREIPIKTEGSMPYARLTLYVQEPSESLMIQERPLVLICPGGGYSHTSDREAEPVALSFMAKGYHAAVLRYSCMPARYPVQLTELAFSMKYLRDHADEWHIKRDGIIVQGSSAGGHLAACMGIFYGEEWLQKAVGASGEELRPDGVMLSYPVITSGEYAHRGSFDCLLGESGSGTEGSAPAEKLSLETQVTAKVPPTFIWHTFSDDAVPVENSLLYAAALRKAGVPTELHIYPEGRHGLALAGRLTASAGGGHMQRECESWLGLACTWLEKFR